MENLKSITEQLTVNSKYKLTTNCYTGKEIVQVLESFSDLVPVEHRGFYAKRLKAIGKDRFIELANKARAGSDTPDRLFNWMVQNQELVR